MQMTSLNLVVLCCGMCLLTTSVHSELPPVGNLASQTLSAFLNHWTDSQTLRKSSPNAYENVVADGLVHTSEVGTHLAYATLVITQMYDRVDNDNRAAAFRELKDYLQLVGANLDDQVSRCNWVISTSRRSSVISEAEHLRRDLRTFKDYARQMTLMQPVGQLPKFDDILPKRKQPHL